MQWRVGRPSRPDRMAACRALRDGWHGSRRRRRRRWRRLPRCQVETRSRGDAVDGTPSPRRRSRGPCERRRQTRGGRHGRVRARGNQAPSHERHAAARAAWRPRGPRAESCGAGPAGHRCGRGPAAGAGTNPDAEGKKHPGREVERPCPSRVRRRLPGVESRSPRIVRA